MEQPTFDLQQLVAMSFSAGMAQSEIDRYLRKEAENENPGNKVTRITQLPRGEGFYRIEFDNTFPIIIQYSQRDIAGYERAMCSFVYDPEYKQYVSTMFYYCKLESRHTCEDFIDNLLQ